MSRKFTLKVPRKPILRRQTYDIPATYLDVYHKAGITNSDELMILFHVTQFGGFRLKRVPANMRFNKGFIEKWFKHENGFGYHHFRANPCFLRKFGGLEIKALEKRWRSDVLNDDEMREHGFSDDEIRKAEAFLSDLNDFYSSLRLDIQVPQTGITAEDRIQLSRFHGIPYLVKKPKAGGRFFHPETSYQRISSSIRPMMTINGKKTSEVDLSAATIQFLNIALGKHSLGSIEDTLLSYDDPYQYFLSTLNSEDVLRQYDERPMGRETLKTILYTAIYSSESKQVFNVDRKLRLMGRAYSHRDLVSFFPEFFNALSALKSGTGLPAHMVIYREESRYTQEVLQRGCLERKLPILPIHDSFITTTSNSKNLKEIMDDASVRLYGRPLSHKQKY